MKRLVVVLLILSCISNSVQIRSQAQITRRPGTKRIALVKKSADPTRIIAFDAYIIEAGDIYFRLYRNGGQILDGGSPYEIVSPYDCNDIFGVQYVQDAENMRMVHPDYPPYKLTRTGHKAWTCTEITFQDGPFLEQNKDTSLTITPSARTGSITLTASANLFDVSGHVGALWQLSHDVVVITAVASSTSATATVIDTLPSTDATWRWAEGAWSTFRGFPRTIEHHEQRAIYGGSASFPQTIWASIIASEDADYDNFTEGDTEADAWTYVLPGTNSIKWMRSKDSLMVGTTYLKGDGILEIDFQKLPHPVLWCITDDGALLSCTYHRKPELINE